MARSATTVSLPMDLATRACFALSRRLLRPPAERTVDYGAYETWRHASLSRSFDAFSDAHIDGKEVLDFGCGDGQLSLFLAREKRPRRVVGVDLNPAAIERARAALATVADRIEADVEFLVGSPQGLPQPERSFDTLLAFDCLEHVMAPGPILREWYRVLRPGGRCLIEWYPFKGPWGPHMEALIPVPWAHVLFGQRAMFRTAEMIYELPEFAPRHWDLDEHGRKRPNKWRAWSSFAEQGYVNELDLAGFRALARAAGFEVARLDLHSFGGSRARRTAGRALMRLPLVGEYFVSYAAIELLRPAVQD
jgi:ubiquinone/menaquinone biosynthesis C-methylase UbiE